MVGVAYPRRQDAVRYEQFDGTMSSIQLISNLTTTTAYITVNPDLRFYCGDVATVEVFELGSESVKIGEYVVRSELPDEKRFKIEVLDRDDFHDRYSKDGS